MDKSLSLILLVIFYILGLVAYFSGLSVFFAIILAFVLIFLVLKNICSSKLVVLFYLFFILAFINCNFQVKAVDDLALLAPQKNAVILGTISSNLTTNNPEKTRFHVNVKNIQIKDEKPKNVVAKTIVTIKDNKNRYNKLEIGDEIQIKGDLYLPISATNPSQFDYANYLKTKNVFTTFYAKDDCFKRIAGPTELKWKFLQKLNILKTKIILKHSKYIKSPNIEVLGGIILGDDAINPPDEIKTSFINSGLLHILAASGMNVALIFGLWYFLAMRLRMNYRFSIAGGMILVLFYTCMTGFPPSILRAALMLEFVLFGKLINRQANTISLLFFVALILLSARPSMINEIGFQLSFVVTFGLILMCPVLCDFFNKKIPAAISDVICIPLIAQIWVIPIQMFYFNTFATYSLFANIAIMPFLAATSFVGFVSFILSLVPFIGDKVCFVFSYILNFTVSALVAISDFFATMPHSLLITFKPDISQIILYYVLLLILFYLLKNKLQNKKIVIVFISLVFLFCVSFCSFQRKGSEIIFFDVKNADLILLKNPMGDYFLIDTGKLPFNSTNSQARTIAGKYLKDRGIKKINSLILTHYDSDHAGGFSHFVEDFKIENFILNKMNDNSNLYKGINYYFVENQINPIYAKNNEIIYEDKGFALKTFQNIDKKEQSDNENSVVTLLTVKDNNILFMGDAGEFAYKNIEKYLPKTINTIKIGHHGAKKTINLQMIKDKKIKNAVISVDYGSYYHPHIETLTVLEKNKVRIFRTDSENAVKIFIPENSNEMFFYGFDTKTKKFRLL